MEITTDFENCLTYMRGFFGMLEGFSPRLKDFILQSDQTTINRALKDIESAQAKIRVLQSSLAEERSISEVK